MHFRHPLRCPRLNLAENGVAVDVEVVVEVPEIEDDVKSNKKCSTNPNTHREARQNVTLLENVETGRDASL